MDWRQLFCFLFIGMFPLFVCAQTPLGLWQTYDLSHKPRDIIRISFQEGELIGTLVKSSNKIPVCSACTGNWHNKPFQGMRIIWGLKQQGNRWVNGHVLSIDNGKIYRCRITVSENNKILYFSPYIGAPLFGVTLKWIRVV